MLKTRDIVVIGGSMGAIDDLRKILTGLPGDFPAALFAVVHTSSSSPGGLADVLARKSALPVQSARDGAPIMYGSLTIAPPDRHLLLKNDRLRLTRGPRENRTRPAIDPLFRSAAVCCTSRVTGVVLSGYLDDGAAGLEAIQRCGGLSVVLDPATALYPDMPRSALRSVKADHCIPAAAMPALLGELVRQPAPAPPAVPEALRLEAEMTEKAMGKFGQKNEPGRSTDLSCPECGGPLWQMEQSKMARFRCTVGHAFTEENLLASQGEAAEQALWIALRTLEERVRFLRNLGERARGHNLPHSRWEAEAAETRSHAEAIRQLLAGRGSVEALS